MNRRKFLGIAGVSVALAGVTYFITSDKHSFTRADMKQGNTGNNRLQPDETEILYLASLAPSGHNTQPWIIKYLEPYHWIIANDKSKWLPAVDPTQRETILSIGTFIQNLEYAASNLGYSCDFTMLASTNQDEDIMEIKLSQSANLPSYTVQKIKQRRTVRSNFLNTELKKEDISHLITGEPDFFHFIPRTTKEYNWLNEQTIEANRIQTYRNDAQKELASWIRFSNKEAEKYCDGLTTASMEIEGVSGWILRNFYGKDDVLKTSFRETGLDKVKKQASQSAGWLLITSKDNTLPTLIESGKRMQRLF
jgi:hypothetical protein